MIRKITAKSILRKHKRVDSWFISCYGMNLYRGCVHNCIYCDGRAEQYYVDGEFGEDVSVKVNAIDILARELDPGRKRKPFTPCYFILGGGVGDSYQPVEKEYTLTRQALELLLAFGHPVSALTKSSLILRDIDLIKKINEESGALVSVSFSSVDRKLSALLEPGVPCPEERLEVLTEAHKQGIPCGMFLMPVVPFLTDTDEQIENSVRAAKECHCDYIIFSGMTLKDGRQKIHFYKNIRPTYPSLEPSFENIYRGNKWGGSIESYAGEIHARFARAAKKYKIPVRVPYRLFGQILRQRETVMVILDHIDYFLKLKGQRSSFGYGSHLISKIKQPLEDAGDKINALPVHSKVKEVIREILKTGSSVLYKNLSSIFEKTG